MTTIRTLATQLGITIGDIQEIVTGTDPEITDTWWTGDDTDFDATTLTAEGVEDITAFVAAHEPDTPWTRTIVIDLDTEFEGSGLEITDWTGAREMIDRAAESLGYDTCYDMSYDPRPEWGGDIAAHDAACDEVRDVVDSDSLIAAGVAVAS